MMRLSLCDRQSFKQRMADEFYVLLDTKVDIFVSTPVASVNYCDGLDRCMLYCILFVFMLVLLCFCVAAEFSMNKDLYKVDNVEDVLPSQSLGSRLYAPMKRKEYNWHSAGSLGWPFPIQNINILFCQFVQIKYTEALLSNCTRKLL